MFKCNRTSRRTSPSESCESINTYWCCKVCALCQRRQPSLWTVHSRIYLVSCSSPGWPLQTWRVLVFSRVVSVAGVVLVASAQPPV